MRQGRSIEPVLLIFQPRKFTTQGRALRTKDRRISPGVKIAAGFAEPDCRAVVVVGQFVGNRRVKSFPPKQAERLVPFDLLEIGLHDLFDDLRQLLKIHARLIRPAEFELRAAAPQEKSNPS